VRALIIDDEPLARRGVILRLRMFKDVEVIGECGDGASAVEKIMNLSPDVVFLDVQMPGMDGFDVLRALPMEKLPAVIFLTAHEQHALRAFEFHALDYLLKPLHDERFAAAIDRARKLMESTLKASMVERVLQMLGQTPEKYVARFTVQTGTRIQIVLADDIESRGSIQRNSFAYIDRGLSKQPTLWSCNPSITGNSLSKCRTAPNTAPVALTQTDSSAGCQREGLGESASNPANRVASNLLFQIKKVFDECIGVDGSNAVTDFQERRLRRSVAIDTTIPGSGPTQR
jgi:DNA-binding LytR/AlgR family response regulator